MPEPFPLPPSDRPAAPSPDTTDASAPASPAASRDEDRVATLEAQLREAQRFAVIGRVADGLVHEFNNLLSGMCGYAELAQERLPADHPAHAQLAKVRALGQDARALVRRILDARRQTMPDTLPEGFAPAADEAPRGHGESILWVDDNPATGAVIEEMLTLLGYRVTYLADADDALARIRAQPAGCDLLLTDLALPGLGGMELAKQALVLHPRLPVLVISGRVDSRQAEDLLHAGVREVLLKPVPRVQLARTVARHLHAAT